MNSKKITEILNGHVDALPGFFEGLEEWCLQRGVAPQLTMQFVLMLDELLTNVAMHAYEGRGGWVEVAVEVLEPMGLQARICDQGPAFDPTQRSPVDVTASLEERPIGGLGVHFIHQLASEFAYQRVNGLNVVTIKKMSAQA